MSWKHSWPGWCTTASRTIRRAAAVLQYGEDPAIEPAAAGPGVLKAAGDAERRKETLDEFERVNRVALTDFRVI